MAREYAQVKVKIWHDDDFRSLPMPAQHLYFVLLTSPTLTHCGIADWRPKRLAALAGDWTEGQVNWAAAVLSERLYIVVDDETEEVLIRSFVRHDGLMKQPKMAVSMANAYAGAASRVLRGVVVHELLRLREDEPELSGWVRPQAQLLLAGTPVDPTLLGVPDSLVSGLSEDAFRGGFTPGLVESQRSVKGSPTPAPAPTPANSNLLLAPSHFDEFWTSYPKKVGKDAAKRAWDKAIRRAARADILAGVERYATDPNLPEKQFIPDPASWLNAGRWADEPLPPPPSPRPTRPSTDHILQGVADRVARSRNTHQEIEA